MSLPTHPVGVHGSSLCAGPERDEVTYEVAIMHKHWRGDQTRRFTNERPCLCDFPLSLSINRPSLLRTRGEVNPTKTVDMYKDVQ
jgi:hypothetical protein